MFVVTVDLDILRLNMFLETLLLICLLMVSRQARKLIIYLRNISRIAIPWINIPISYTGTLIVINNKKNNIYMIFSYLIENIQNNNFKCLWCNICALKRSASIFDNKISLIFLGTICCNFYISSTGIILYANKSVYHNSFTDLGWFFFFILARNGMRIFYLGSGNVSSNRLVSVSFALAFPEQQFKGNRKKMNHLEWKNN